MGFIPFGKEIGFQIRFSPTRRFKWVIVADDMNRHFPLHSICYLRDDEGKLNTEERILA